MEIQKAIELIEKSEHIGIALSPEFELDEAVSAEVIAEILQKKEKHIGLLFPAVKDLLQKFPAPLKIASSPELLKEYVISIDSSRFPVSQLRYEKNEDELEIILSPKNYPLSSEAFSFREGKTQCDLAILIGIKNTDNLNITDLEPDFFTETPIINFDISEENQRFGEANLVSSEKSSISELVYEFMTKFEPAPLEEKNASLLLAGIFQKTNQLQLSNLNPNTFLTVSELMRLGANYLQALKWSRGSISFELMQLIGRASVRTKIDHEKEILWSFVTSEDFEKTGRTYQDFPKILAYLSVNFPPHKLTVLLWQNYENGQIYASFKGEEKLLKTLQDNTGGEFHNLCLLISENFATFREAEHKISTLLDKIL